MKTTIVIPAADVTPPSADLLDSLLTSIQDNGYDKTYNVIVCFDGCHPNFIDHFMDNFPFIEPIVNKGNRLNFCGNSNNGLKRAFELGTHAILVNQDTILPPNLDTIYGEGLVSPQQVTHEGEYAQIVEKLAQQPILERQQHNKVVGFCLFINYKVMEKVGFLDTYFKASFDDDDYCIRAKLAGFPVETVSTQVHHAVSKCGAYDGAKLQLNWSKFRYKWTIPNDMEHLKAAEWILNNHTWHPAMKLVD